MKVLKWLSVSAVVLACALGACMWWVVASFDTRTLPANHGKVVAELYDAVVALVPGSAVFASGTNAMVTPAFSLHEAPLPFVPVPWSTTWDLLTGNLRGAFETMMRDAGAMQRAAIPVERMRGPVLFVSATRDEVWPSAEMAQAMLQRLQAHGFPHVAEHVAVDGGHAEPLDEFPRIEAFLARHFARTCR